MKKRNLLIIILSLFLGNSVVAQQQAQNPIIHADFPDASIIRVDDTYYMSSTTMHMNPGVPIMKSTDLVNWEIVNYAYNILGDTDALNLENGENAYGRGSWASSLRYHNDTFYVSTFSSTTGKTYIFKTKDIENGSFEEISFTPSLHDNTLFFDDDGKTYLIWGGGKLNIVELKEDLSGVKEGTESVLIENATEPIGSNFILPAEGSQIFKTNGKYYLFNIAWPRDGMRTVIIHRADKITGPYEGKLAFQDKGVAQGGLIDTPEGNWFAYLFRDYGAVGRIPYLVPVKWENGWPVLGENGKVPETLDLPVNESLIPGIVASDDFSRKSGDRDLPLVWQWNHNPQPDFWSVKDRAGYLRLTTDRVDTSFLNTRNTLTQRTIGPESSAITKIDLSGMKDGDYAGLGLLQKNFGFVGAKMLNNKKQIIMVNGVSEEPIEVESIPLNQEELYLKAVGDFEDRKDTAKFYYSLDGENWKAIGNQLKMSYTLPHFMGYRFALFNYATEEAGGYVDFDYFKIYDQIN
ncbi:glycoside hydrolase family 43 protein [Salegentibacter salegens]|uniref:Beta-xylosidase n=1 Tax=Salegentibacter salegens TaxID=143223 RepID=A0A1M7N3Y7_9FLAO|nr:glycoside hydrolase 43 family protein [Salegentibacter salegens]PRX46836.1 beta-xylosidase [Salegentibacter salegens]SHM98186.1 Beta-xylosidase [Salegentibacter salegens]